MKNITGVVALLIVGGNILYNSWVQPALAPIVYAREPDPPEVVQIATKIDWTKDRINKEIEEQAAEYGVSAEVMKTVVNCESQYNVKALGDQGHSRGLVQIHDQYHDVTDEEAYDPEFAIEFLAKHLAEGNGKLWTCFRLNY